MNKMKNIDQEFLHTLHIEKIRTQNERAELVKKKLAFITIFHMKNIKKTGWDDYPHPSFNPFFTKYPA